MDPRESFERKAGSFDAAYIFSYVELGDLIALAVARIGDIDSDFYIIAAAGSRRLHGKMVIAEGGVTQSEPEGKERLAIVIDVLVSARWVAVVEHWQLPHAAGKGDGEASARIVVTEERFSNCLAAKLARIPCFQNCRNVLLRPADSQRPTVFQHQHDRLARRHDRFQ